MQVKIGIAIVLTTVISVAFLVRFWPRCLKIPHFGDPSEPPARIITVTVNNKHRLGNRMFNLASLLGIAQTNHMQPRIGKDFDRMMQFFQLNFTRSLSRTSENDTYAEFFRDKSRVCDNRTNLLSLWKDDIRMSGSFNCFYGFSHIEDLIRTEFAPKVQYKNTVLKLFSANIPAAELEEILVSRVGIHIRRGDFVDNKFGFVPAEDGYFNRAMRFMDQQLKGFYVQYYVTSDDIQYARRVIRGKNVVFSPFRSPEQDLILLSMCDHVISSTGTFSFWAGWLSNGIVTYYKNFPRKNSTFSQRFQPEQFYPSDWVPME